LQRVSAPRFHFDPRGRNDNQPLVIISPDKIIPAPLHVLLGIADKIVKDSFSVIFGAEQAKQAIDSVKTSHSAGGGGIRDVFSLNGNELRRYIKRKVHEKLIAGKPLDTATLSNVRTMIGWLNELYANLLHARHWTAEEIEHFAKLVDDIARRWYVVTRFPITPKVHILLHCVPFVRQTGVLGLVSESQVESTHRKFTLSLQDHHFNTVHNPPEQIRRGLADNLVNTIVLPATFASR